MIYFILISLKSYISVDIFVEIHYYTHKLIKFIDILYYVVNNYIDLLHLFKVVLNLRSHFIYKS